MSQPRFQDQPIRAAGAQDDHPQIVLSQIGTERPLAARRQYDQALLVHLALQQVGVMDGTADEGAFHPVLQDVLYQLPARTGLEAEIDLREVGDELRENRRQAQRSCRLERTDDNASLPASL